MLDLDKYIDDRCDIKIFGEMVSVKEPTVRMYAELMKIEENLNKENLATKRIKTAVLFLNNNADGKVYTDEMFAEVPFAVVDAVSKTITSMREQVEKDPN